MTVRPAREADIPVLRSLERAAGQPFLAIGMTSVAQDEPPSAATLSGFVAEGRAWVYEVDGRPVAYLLAEVVDGNGHVEQVSVHPDHARRRLGRVLIDHLLEWARRRDLPAVTLTTYTEVPWNGPYYERCGFRYLTEAEETPGLRAIRAAELAHGLDRWPRACMRLDL
ncbi:GNAT family N-acetyltransferase [Actinophytocola oryzae]|uniref:Putative N-acetyltransferase YhbS n=1 Tax=Actinophytocola oryzae TaxID=502181 RepID=A0A4V3FTN8_9PSEU|nr:GNAT family N-acetyltransferase [Actinophytocola oryzae]TDV52051.1 putative N-acetyltransferase YhbS [Actinophytocola oryzae]